MIPTFTRPLFAMRSLLSGNNKETSGGSRQRERDVCAARGRFRIFPSAAGDDYILLSVDHVGCGCSDGGKRQNGFPEQFTGETIEGAKLLVIDGCANEQDVARGHDRA